MAVHYLLSPGTVTGCYRVHQLFMSVVGARRQGTKDCAKRCISRCQPSLNRFDDKVVTGNSRYFAVEL